MLLVAPFVIPVTSIVVKATERLVLRYAAVINARSVHAKARLVFRLVGFATSSLVKADRAATSV